MAKPESLPASPAPESEIKISQHAEHILRTLDLDWKSLQGKKILDVGAGLAELAQTAKEHGITITSLEKNQEPTAAEILLKDIPFVKATVEKIPFKDESFDLIICHAAPPIIAATKQEVEQALADVLRVLKEDGEFRFGPAPLSPAIFATDELFSPAEEAKFSTLERVKRIKEKSLAYLQTLYPQIVEKKSRTDKYYLLQKQKASDPAH